LRRLRPITSIGLPVAPRGQISLAAARIKLLSPQALLARLSGRLTLLTGGARDLLARQQTLRSTIDWRTIGAARPARLRERPSRAPREWR
jgi:hypothetical protein